jgi:large subunit ribosomal protein L32
MAVPKRRKTKSRRNQRRMHLYITPATLTLCPKCKKPVMAHTACKNCGYYKGVEVINVLGKLTKKEKKAREKQIKETEKESKSEKPLEAGELSKK